MQQSKIPNIKDKLKMMPWCLRLIFLFWKRKYNAVRDICTEINEKEKWIYELWKV